jgi:hypothetical protein
MMKRRRPGMLLGLALMALTMSAAPAGDFHFGKVRFQPIDALAYQVEGKEPGKPLTLIALADFKIDRTGVMEAIDTPSALAAQADKNQGNFVMVRLSAPDRCGVGGFLAKTQQQIDLGDSFPSKTSIGTTRVAGECHTDKPGKMFDDAYDFRLPYDAPLTVIPAPAALPAGGGEPGRVLVALVKAIAAADWNGARLHLREEEVPQTPPKASEMSEYFHGLALNYPKTATVTGGLMKGDRANLEIQGRDNDGKKIRGVFAMKKIAGNWRVLDQSLYFAD